MQHYMAVILLSMGFVLPLWADTEGEHQDCIMLLDTLLDTTNDKRSVVMMRHQGGGGPQAGDDKNKALPIVRKVYVQMWRSLPTGMAAEPHCQESKEGSEAEPFLTPEVDQPIQILDPSAYLSVMPGQEGFGSRVVPVEAACLEVVQHGDANTFVSPVFVKPAAQAEKFTMLVSCNS